MAKKKDSVDKFFDGLFDLAAGLTMGAIASHMEDKHQYSKKGKINPYAATARGLASGRLKSTEDLIRMGGALGALGAFDDDNDDYSCDYGTSYDDRYEWRDYCEDGSDYDVDPLDYETEEEYEEALQQAKYGWREFCEDGSDFDLDPEDFETEDDYNEALEEAKYAWREKYEDIDVYLDPEDYETEEEFIEELADLRKRYEAISAEAECSDDDEEDEEESTTEPRQSDYPNVRQFKAAEGLCYIEEYGGATTPDKKIEKERYEFILKKYKEIIAANYLTADGEFLYGQAVKENFELPFEMEDEDETAKERLDELIGDIADSNPRLAIEIWLWCLRNFLPYGRYSCCEGDVIYCINGTIDEYPIEFSLCLFEEFDKDLALIDIMMGGDDANIAVEFLPGLALEHGRFDLASKIFISYISAQKDADEIIRAVDNMVWNCETGEELETMEQFQSTVFPAVEALSNPKVQRKIPKWKKRMADYIDEMESECEKYAYTRKYAWRADCEDGSRYGVDPIDYDTLEAYNAALLEERYGWREECSYGEQYGLYAKDFETEDDYEKAVAAAGKEEYRKEKARLAAEKAASRPEAKKHAPRRTVDKSKVYTFCGVMFDSSNRVYHYLAEGIEPDIGDKVIVPVGTNNTERTATVVSVEKCLPVSAPYPIESAKTILKKADGE